MEEVSKGLSSSSHSATVLQSVTSLHTKISAGTAEEKEAATKLLWAQLGQDSVLASQAAADLLGILVRSGQLEAGAAISQLLACLSHGLEYSGLVPGLGAALCHQARLAIARPGGYRPGQYRISSHQHPFISVLRSTPAAWSLVLDQCLHILDHPDPDIRTHSLAILRPVLLYLFCDPNHHLHFGAIRAALLEALLDVAKEDASALKFLVEMIDWMKMDNKASLQETAHYIYKVYNWCLINKELDFVRNIAQILPSLALYQVKHGYSADRSVRLLEELLDKEESEGGALLPWDAAVLVLARALDTGPHPGHAPLLRLLTRLLPRVARVTAAHVAVTCLQALPFPAQLPGHCADLKAAFVRLFYSHPWPGPGNGAALTPTKLEHPPSDTQMKEAMETVAIISMVSETPEECERWLTSLTSLPHAHLTASYPLLAALFLCSSSAAAGQLSLQLLLQCVAAAPGLSTPLLSLVLHKLASDTMEAELKLALLHALPSMAADKTCISLILKLVTSLASRPSLAPLRLNILYKLWRVEARAFPFLQKALLEPAPASCALEVQTTQAAVIRAIVSTHAAQHGSDLLPALSAILNTCVAPEAGTACGLALAGIHTLLRHSVIDMKTTVKVLAPKCSRDPRPMVLIGYIKLLGLAPTFKLSGSEYQNFLMENVKW